MQRVKNIDYDEDDLYDDDEYADDAGGNEEYTAENRENFASLTPVVRAEIDEAGLQASDREIEDALWHYYWDVGKSVTYLKNSRAPQEPQQATRKEQKPKSKFDEAAEKNAQEADLPSLPPMDPRCWFRDVPWTATSELEGSLSPVCHRTRPELLGGSSKLAKLAEERRKKAAAAQEQSADPALSALDRLTNKDSKENERPPQHVERKYPVRKKRSPTPPPREPTPPPVSEPEPEMPDLKASPTAFGRTLSHGETAKCPQSLSLRDVLGSDVAEDPFKQPSPDDVVLRAQQHSKGLRK